MDALSSAAVLFGVVETVTRRHAPQVNADSIINALCIHMGVSRNSLCEAFGDNCAPLIPKLVNIAEFAAIIDPHCKSDPALTAKACAAICAHQHTLSAICGRVLFTCPFPSSTSLVKAISDDQSMLPLLCSFAEMKILPALGPILRMLAAQRCYAIEFTIRDAAKKIPATHVQALIANGSEMRKALSRMLNVTEQSIGREFERFAHAILSSVQHTAHIKPLTWEDALKCYA